MSYHHFSSISTITGILSTFLSDNGVLIVCDFRSSSGTAAIGEEYAHIVPHRAGFQVQEMQDAFTGAGLGDFSSEDIISAKVHGIDAQIFIAKGTRKF
jgi:hypothetical protein